MAERGIVTKTIRVQGSNEVVHLHGVEPLEKEHHGITDPLRKLWSHGIMSHRHKEED